MMEEGLCDTFAGALGGLACVLAGQPLDTVKVKQQTYPQVYRTMSQTLSKTFWQEGGLLGFYAGCGSAVFSNVAENAVLFFSFERCQQLVRWTLDLRSADDMNALHQAYAGALASVVSSVVINPLERIKCKQQVHHQQSQYFHQNSSAWRVAGHILSKEGVGGLFRGLTSTWAREVPGYFLFFGGYSASRKMLTPTGSDDNLSMWRLGVAGGVAGCCFWTAIFPADVVKSRVQVKQEVSGSVLVTMYNIIRNEGVMALYRGLLPTLVRSFPANGALFVTYEYTRQLLMPHPHDTESAQFS